MRRFIILRGPPGIGKTKISEYLVLTFGKAKTHYFSLDQQEGFEQNIQTALTKELVIGEMFFGDSHTTRPEQWLNKFSEYCKASFDICCIDINPGWFLSNTCVAYSEGTDIVW